MSSVCAECGNECRPTYKFCDKCRDQVIDWDTRTIRQEINKNKIRVTANIRDRARRTYLRSDKPKCCINCGYDKHFEVCHIKGIKDFDIDTPVSVVNDLDNLIALCPNCHTELDRNLLDENCILYEQNIIPRSYVGANYHEPIMYPCAHCKQPFKVTYDRKKYCSIACAGAGCRKVDRPSKEQLADDISTMRWVAIGNKYGVSDNTVRKWARTYGLL